MSNSTIHGAKGEILTGTSADDTLKGGSGPDSIMGLDGNDSLAGSRGADSLDGGAGNDTLDGGQGADVLTGGAGQDTFLITDRSVATTEAGLDRITDFTHGDDRIGFGGAISLAGHSFYSGTEATYDGALARATTEITSGHSDMAFIQVGNDVVVFADSNLHNQVDGAVVLVGKTLADITQWDVF